MRAKAIWTAMLGVTLCAGVALATQNPIADRKALMKDSGRQAGLLKGIIIDGKAPLADAVGPADELAALFAKLPPLFPPGSDQGDTRAAPAIWANFAGFEQHVKTSEQLAKAVSDAAAKGDAAGARAAFDRLGQDGCGSCHSDFRKSRS